MSDVNEAWSKEQRARWLRPNGHLYVRADAWRLAPPGTPEAKPPGWLDPSMTRVRWKEAQEEEERAAFAAEVKRLQAEQDRLCQMLAEIKYDLAWRKLCRKYGYDPDQPRDELGRWTSGTGDAAQATGEGQVADADTEGSIDQPPSPSEPSSTDGAASNPESRVIPVQMAVDERPLYDKADSALLTPKGVNAASSEQKLKYTLDDGVGLLQGPGQVEITAFNMGALYTGVIIGARRVQQRL